MGDRDLSRDEEVVELTRRFKTFLMENKERFENVWGEVTSAKVQKIELCRQIWKACHCLSFVLRRGTQEGGLSRK